ncbi:MULTISPECIES: hypothetical protein [unclassified Paenibacillus]|uniref:hypothetical protein n=1 Tax=unclassified Paenibacillus TaxID=185978 RepID=UPI00191646E4|nr:hypothetical protein [Paenibacillus sp. EPM92]
MADRYPTGSDGKTCCSFRFFGTVPLAQLLPSDCKLNEGEAQQERLPLSPSRLHFTCGHEI